MKMPSCFALCRMEVSHSTTCVAKRPFLPGHLVQQCLNFAATSSTGENEGQKSDPMVKAKGIKVQSRQVRRTLDPRMFNRHREHSTPCRAEPLASCLLQNC